MLENELIEIVKKFVDLKCETSNIEFKAAKNGCPEKLYDTLSSFSNTKGGIIIFGVDEKRGYTVVGVDDVQELQKKIMEQSLDMEPVVRPLFTTAKYEDKVIFSAEIPEIDAFSKPCFYKGKGKIKGSYIRVGDGDLPMTDYEIHSYDAFRYKTEDELRSKERIDDTFLSTILLDGYISKLVSKKTNLINIDKNKILQLEGIINHNGIPTLCGILNFGILPQIISPNLDIVAVRCATNEYGKEDIEGIRFIDNKRIDGTIQSMLQQALAFISINTQKSTYVNPTTGKREDKTEYPVKALREVVLNALIHRDYSVFTENDPIRIEIYNDRIEVSNPGGLYGRLTLDGLGLVRSDIRNPYISSILETLEITENRYSGIPTIIEEMKKANLPAPKFEDDRGVFKVTLYNSKYDSQLDSISKRMIEICKTPRTKEYLAHEFGYNGAHPYYFVNTYIVPLIEKGLLKYTLPNKPRSKNQKIVAA